MRLTPEDLAYLREAAARDHYNPSDALKLFNYESSGDPTRWGGKGGLYFGLFQAGGPERAQFGIDTVHPSARNQIDAFGRYLHARGFKPGMGLADMYSTVLAGRPGLYNRSDGAGTVSEHLARMNGSAASGGLASAFSSVSAGDQSPKDYPTFASPPPDLSPYDLASFGGGDNPGMSVSGGAADEAEYAPELQETPETYAQPEMPVARSAQDAPLRTITQRAISARVTPDLSPLAELFTLDETIGRRRA